ncbi:MAG: hypothetical protein ACOYOU_06745 [Kiritimatiellia bacterium]
MGTVLRVLVVFILILSGTALFLAIMLYGRRELLINRTHLLEEQFRKVVKTIEAEPAPEVQKNYVSKDISPVTSKEMENPERSTFWNTYQHKLETPNLPTMTWDSNEKQLQIRQYYQLKLNPVNNKMEKVKHPVNQGEFSTEGEGTMREILDVLLDRATKQLATLNKTRVELQKVREELATTIEEHNKLKQDGRADKKTIDELRKEIDNLKEQIRGLERKVAGLEEEKKNLTAELTEVKTDLEAKKTMIEEMTKKIKEQEATIKRLMKPTIVTAGNQQQAEAFQGTPGVKGKVVAVDDTLKFVVVELSELAMTELLGEQRDRPMPQVELMIRRAGFKSTAGEFITRIKFRQVLRQKNLVVADILIDWQQSPVAKDDIVFF